MIANVCQNFNAKWQLPFSPHVCHQCSDAVPECYTIHSGLWTTDCWWKPRRQNVLSSLWTLDSGRKFEPPYYYSPLHFQCLAKGSGAQAFKTTFLQTLFGNLWRRVIKWWNAWSAEELALTPPWASKRKLCQFLHQLATLLLGQLLTFIGRIKTAPQAASNTTHPKLHTSTEGLKAFWRLAIRPSNCHSSGGLYQLVTYCSKRGSDCKELVAGCHLSAIPKSHTFKQFNSAHQRMLEGFMSKCKRPAFLCKTRRAHSSWETKALSGFGASDPFSEITLAKLEPPKDNDIHGHGSAEGLAARRMGNHWLSQALRDAKDFNRSASYSAPSVAWLPLKTFTAHGCPCGVAARKTLP